MNAKTDTFFAEGDRVQHIGDGSWCHGWVGTVKSVRITGNGGVVYGIAHDLQPATLCYYEASKLTRHGSMGGA